jgi:hypothetical protein
MLFRENVKDPKRTKDGALKCKCGSVRYEVEVYPDDDGEYNWITVNCKRCGNVLFSNGA